MNSRKQIFNFLKGIAQHNERTWFQSHRSEYETAASTFRSMAECLIERISIFEPEVSDIDVNSTLYRFYRDTRFSQDKSPYKQHFGTYINTKGKKSLHGGYYFHMEPNGNSMVACGAYWLPTNILNAVRRSIVADTDRFIQIVENPEFRELYPIIGQNRLKTIPKDFPRDYPYPQYINPKDYVVWHMLSDEEIERADWLDNVSAKFKIIKPFLDFINETVDDYIDE